MKLISTKTIIPATAIALGTTAVMSQTGYAYEVTVYPVDDAPIYESSQVETPYSPNSYSHVNRANRQTYPGYHYAYYDIARPEYIL